MRLSRSWGGIESREKLTATIEQIQGSDLPPAVVDAAVAAARERWEQIDK